MSHVRAHEQNTVLCEEKELLCTSHSIQRIIVCNSFLVPLGVDSDSRLTKSTGAGLAHVQPPPTRTTSAGLVGSSASLVPLNSLQKFQQFQQSNKRSGQEQPVGS